MRFATPWSERVEEILDGDHAVVLAYATPARGVVLAPVSNFGLHNRAEGVVTVNSSVGVEIRITVERIVVWPDLACQGAPEVEGVPLPAEVPASQERPAKGTAPRVNHARAARRAKRLPNVLLGWVGVDGFPFVVPVNVGATNDDGILLDSPPRTAPPGGRRAGLTAHWFSRGVAGQRHVICTGWMESSGGEVTYAPHTLAAYRMPSSRLIYQFVVGLFTRLRYRQATNRGTG